MSETTTRTGSPSFASIDAADATIDALTFRKASGASQTLAGLAAEVDAIEPSRTWNFRGAWVANTAYAVDDVLTYDGSSYLVTTAFTSGTEFATTNLSVIAEKGDPGADGEGQQGTSIADVQASQGAVTAGSPSTVTLTTTLSDGSSKTTSFVAPPGAPGNGDGGSYTLPAATTATLGGIKVGSNLTVATDGTLSGQAPTPAYTLPAATSSALGGVKIGSGLSVASDGTISASGGSGGSSTVPVTTATISAATYALAASVSGDAAYDLTISAATTLSVSGGTSGQMQRVFLQLRQTGAFGVTLPANVKWNGGTAPAVTQIAGQIAQFALATLDGGTTWTGQEGF